MSAGTIYVVTMNLTAPTGGTGSVIVSFDQSVVNQGWFASYGANGTVAGNAIQTQFGFAVPAGSSGIALGGISQVPTLSGTLAPQSALPAAVTLTLYTTAGTPGMVLGTVPANSATPVTFNVNIPTAQGFTEADIKKRATAVRNGQAF
jgi:hypothetical protein